MSEKPEEPNFLNRVNSEIENVGMNIISNAYENAKQRLIQQASQKIVGVVFGDQNQVQQGLAPPGQTLQPISPPVIPTSIVPPLPFQKQPDPSIEPSALRENLLWLPGGNNGRPNPLALDAETDHFTTSEPVTIINPGEFFEFNLRVIRVGEGGDYAHSLHILLHDAKNEEGGWCIDFVPGKEEISQGCMKVAGQFSEEYKFDLPQFKVNTINQIALEYDGKDLILYINDESVAGYITLPGNSFDLFFRVIGMGVSIWG